MKCLAHLIGHLKIPDLSGIGTNDTHDHVGSLGVQSLFEPSSGFCIAPAGLFVGVSARSTANGVMKIRDWFERGGTGRVSTHFA